MPSNRKANAKPAAATHRSKIELEISKVDVLNKKVRALNSSLEITIQKTEALNALGIDLNAK